MQMNMGITNRCPNMCTTCSTKSTNKPSEPTLSVRQFHGLAKQAKDLGSRIIGLTGGEAFVHPQFREIVGETKKVGFKSIAISSGGWDSQHRDERINLLTNLLSDHSLKYNLNFTFSPFIFGGDQKRVISSWKTTLSDILFKLVPAIKANKSNNQIAFRFLNNGSSSIIDPRFSELVWQNGGVQTGRIRNTAIINFPRQDFTVTLIGVNLEKEGRAENFPKDLPISHTCRSSQILGLLWLHSPYINPLGDLFPCCAEASGTTPKEAVLAVDPEKAHSLENALNRYVKNKRKIFSLRKKIYKQLGQGVSFCKACIQARIEIFN